MKCLVINRKKIVITNIIIYLCIFTFLTNSQTCIVSISNSTNIFLSKLLPSLLPYILLTELIINLNIVENLSYGFSKIICKLFRIPKCSAPTIVMSLLLGYPNAAKHISKLYDNNQIDYITCKKLISFTNNASPAYIIGAIGTAMFNNVYIGIILLISHFLASMLIGFSLNSSKTIIQQNNTNSNSFKQISFSFEILIFSLLNSVKTLILIWGYTVIFSLVPTLILNKLNLPNYLYGLFVGLFEISNGINILASADINFTLSICLISFVLSFSSLMVIMQVYSFIYKTKVKFGYIVLYKLLHGLLSLGITYFLTELFLKKGLISVFSNSDNYAKAQPIPSIVYFGIAAITGFLLILITKRNDK